MQELAIIRQFLAERSHVAPERAVPEASLEELGIDSLMLLELIFEFEDKEGISVPQDIPPPKTVADLVRLFAELRSAPSTPAP